MNKQRQQARELLALEIKLTRLKIAAAHLKHRRLAAQKQNAGRQTLYTLLDLGSELADYRLLSKTAALPIRRKYRFGALLALFALRFWRQGNAVKE
ncbi:hypothetical protein [Neisseria chenwenguii]|uniref:Uncharacterized protein n=1 Tax=Neisseria chenwenguii TaxID=1853278 RepID=A0A220RZJ9_9NEIS|nr:hypothetical protein [Neisseria chenwenguii]ASK26660.1 hypothetical protein BG910_01890 [Neisseria chenwenguii]ROV56321.1 hypothetical protein EGS38_04700 [Neisseria chenwenguii]